MENVQKSIEVTALALWKRGCVAKVLSVSYVWLQARCAVNILGETYLVYKCRSHGRKLEADLTHSKMCQLIGR